VGGKTSKRSNKKQKDEQLEKLNGEPLPERSAMSIPLPVQSFNVVDVPGIEHPTANPPESPDDTTPA
jgi:hypothetical protein